VEILTCYDELTQEVTMTSFTLIDACHWFAGHCRTLGHA